VILSWIRVSRDMDNKGLTMNYRMSFLGLLAGISVFLSANAEHNVPAYIKNPAVSNLTREERNEIISIEKSGIQVIKQGMRFTFLIPVDTFFMKRKQALKSNRENDLDVLGSFVRTYISYFDHPRVSVTGYTDTVLLKPARIKLSRFYANTIAASLQENGVPFEIMKVQGKGSEDQIASNAYPMGASFNRRVVVEIH